MFDNNYLILFLRMEETNLLKFIAKDKAAPLSTGIRTFPHQTYGVSRESPDYFQRTHTIITPNTYHYQH
jgi:sugar (pentulose or hexulose) kinase